jgi:hypothetical protein
MPRHSGGERAFEIPTLRRRRVQGRQAHLLDRLAGDAPLAQAARGDAGDAGSRCPLLYVDGSGCYGRNGHEDATADAALLARAAGRPVRVQWMRADEHGWDPKGPPTLIDLHGGLDGGGQPRRGQEPDRGQYRADDDERSPN